MVPDAEESRLARLKGVYSTGQPTMQRSNAGDGAEGSEPSRPAIDPGVLENQLPQSSYRWLPPDQHQALEQMPELVHGHGSNDGEIDPDADIADLDPSHHQLLNQQANLVRFFDYTHDPFLQSDELGSGHTTNPPARLDESYVHGGIQNPKLQFPSLNRHASWDSYQSQNQMDPGLLQQGSPSPDLPKASVIQSQARIVEDPRAFQLGALHSPEENPSVNGNQFQYMFQSETPAVPLDWSNDFSIPPNDAAEWDPFNLPPQGLQESQQISTRESSQNPALQDQVGIPPGVEGVDIGGTHPLLQQLLPESSLPNVPKAEGSQYHGGSDHEPIFKEESIDSFYLSSPLSNDKHSIVENRQFEDENRYLHFAESTTDISPSNLVPVAQDPEIPNASQETPTSAITRPRSGSAPSKRTKWRGTPNLPQLITEPKETLPDGTDNEKYYRTSPLQIVQEDGQGGSVSGSSYKLTVASRARRMGPLSNTGRRDAAMRRKHKNVCVWCRLAKKKVIFHSFPRLK